EQLNGKLLQGGNSYPLEFQREKLEKKRLNRPQTPRGPFPYSSEDLSIENTKDQVNLAGTLLIPDNWNDNSPIMVFITGSGPQTRNEEIFEHEFFWVIADHLARNGVASFRYDDRGVGESTGSFALATSVDFANDVHSVVNYLSSRKDLEGHPIGLIGHSEGGMIAPMVASNNENVELLVSLAGTGISGKEIIRKQSKSMLIAEGLPKEMASKNSENSMFLLNYVLSSDDSLSVADGMRDKIRAIYSENEIEESGGIDQLFNQFNASMNNNWFRFFAQHNPAVNWSKVTCACLIINGTKDMQVEASANLNAIEFALRRAGNKNYEVHALPSQNHLFQECESGSLSEYGAIETSISSETLDLLLLWIIKQS
ncbi:MAG: alpha/beta hydrolase family protein, partial [Flavobacteriales bacterium]